MEPNIQPSFTFPSRQNIANLALGLDSVIKQQLLTTRPANPLNINLESSFYRNDILPPPNELEVLDVKTVLPICPPIYVQPSIAEGLTAVAEDEFAATQITTLLSANNALRRGNWKAAEYLLKRPLSAEEIQNKSVNPEVRQNEAGQNFAIGPRAGPGSIRGAAYQSQENKFYRMTAEFIRLATKAGLDPAYIASAAERYNARIPHPRNSDERLAEAWNSAIASVEQEIRNIAVAGYDHLRNSSMQQGAADNADRRRREAQDSHNARMARAKEERERNNPYGLPKENTGRSHPDFVVGEDGQVGAYEDYFGDIAVGIQDGQINYSNLTDYGPKFLKAIFAYAKTQGDHLLQARVVNEFDRRYKVQDEGKTMQDQEPGTPGAPIPYDIVVNQNMAARAKRIKEEKEKEAKEAEHQRIEKIGQTDVEIGVSPNPGAGAMSPGNVTPRPATAMSVTDSGATPGTVTSAPIGLDPSMSRQSVVSFTDEVLRPISSSAQDSEMDDQKVPIIAPTDQHMSLSLTGGQPDLIHPPPSLDNLTAFKNEIFTKYGVQQQYAMYDGVSPDQDLSVSTSAQPYAAPASQQSEGRNVSADAAEILSVPAGSADVQGFSLQSQNEPDLNALAGVIDDLVVGKGRYRAALIRAQQALTTWEAHQTHSKDFAESMTIASQRAEQERGIAILHRQLADLDKEIAKQQARYFQLKRDRPESSVSDRGSNKRKAKEKGEGISGGDIGGGAIHRSAKRVRQAAKARSTGVIRVAGAGPNIIGVDGFYGDTAPVTSHIMRQNLRDALPYSAQVQVAENHQFTEPSTRQFIRNPDSTEQLVAEFEPIAVNTSLRVQRPKQSTVFERGHYGKFLINHISLEGKRTLSLSYKGGKKIRGLPNKKLSNNEYSAVKKVLGGGLIGANDKLTKTERTWLAEVHRRAGIPMHPGLMTKTMAGGSLVPGDKVSSLERGRGALANVNPKQQIMDILGEMEAGNDNPKLKTQLHQVADALYRRGQITPALYQECKQHWT